MFSPPIIEHRPRDACYEAFMSPPGRNEPCHCGSGRKYKKCHLAKDLEAARLKAEEAKKRAAVSDDVAVRAVPPHEVPSGASPAASREATSPFEDAESPEMQRWDAFFERFEHASLDERVAMALDAIRNEPAFDDEWCFELLNELNEGLLAANRDEDLRTITDEIATRHAELVDHEPIVGCLRARLALRRGEDPTPFVMEAARADAGSFPLELLFHELRYRGLPAVVETALARAREQAEDDEESSGPYDGELETDLLIDRFVATNPNVSGTDPELVAAVGKAVKIRDREFLARIVDHAAGRGVREWSAADFAAKHDARGETRRLISHDWAFAMNAKGTWPRSRVELARSALVGLVVRSAREAKKRTPDLLLPNAKVAREFVQSLESVHEIAALLAALPSWCSFLAERRIVNEAAAHTALENIRKVLPELQLSLRAGSAVDPQLVRDVEAAWEAEPVGRK